MLREAATCAACVLSLCSSRRLPSAAAESPEASVPQWITALGGAGASIATAVAADSQGNPCIAGNTTSLDLPTVQSPGGADKYTPS